ncbi:MAG: ParB/Srx family N-terminal domain-containing protein [Betaproteobacteria bacterium]|nr:ParB/Srx family N-terminal domain-containing protein [Betaproteobacteria bacterium]
MTAPEIKLVNLDQITPYQKNARTHDETQIVQIANSIDAFGMVGAIIIRNGVIAKGHGTVLAVKKLYESGKKIFPPPGSKSAEPYPDGTIPVIDASGWSNEQFKAYVIADNKIAENAGWDIDILTLELEELDDSGFDLDLIGWNADEIAALLDGSEDHEVKEIHTGKVLDRFWISIRGQLPQQAEVLRRLQEAMADLPVDVELGTVADDGMG